MLTHEFPPSGGGGVQRVAKFARYLPANGWDPLVVTGRVVSSRPTDDTLLEGLGDVAVRRVDAFDLRGAVAWIGAALRRTRRDPAAAAPSKPGSLPGARRVPFSTRVSSWFGIPDHAAFWIGPAVRAAVQVGRDEGVAAVFASGPPHSVLVAGMRAASVLGVPLVADMRDAWRDNPSIRYATPYHRARAVALERRVMRSAALVTCLSGPVAREAREMGARRAVVLPNGFDPADVPTWSPEPGALRMVFMGTMYRPLTDPAPLLAAMAAADPSTPAAAASLRFVGVEPTWVVEDVASLGLQDRVSFLGYRPHAEALALVARADVGVVLLNDMPGSKAVYTGKLFEYLGMGIPILVLGPEDGVAADLVREARAGWTVAYCDVPAAAALVAELAARKAGEGIALDPDPGVVGRYDRRRQAAALAGLLDEVAGPSGDR
jgi:glycosyltransferase involved in cell wall biosynthesis